MKEKTTMEKLKILLKKSTIIGTSALLLVSTLLPTLALGGQLVTSAATTVSGGLTPGGSVDAGNHTWNVNDFRTSSNYTPVGKNTSGSGWMNSSVYNFGTNQSNTGSWLPFKGAVDMSQPITINGLTFANAGGINPQTHLGDANGILLTNLPASQLSQGATGGNLGVGNLGSGTYFIGNNYSHKQYTLIGDLLNQGYQTASVVAQGNGSGAKILSASSDYTATNNADNAFSMSWSNPVVNSNGSVTGTMTYVSTNSGTNYSTSASITVQRSMSIGFMASTGGNYSEMHVTVSGVTAGKGEQPVNVNYINTATGNQLAPNGTPWQNSTINANVGDQIGVVAPNGSGNVNTSDDYDYFAPAAPAGYTFSSVSQSVIVQNFPNGGANPNQINVYYTPGAESGTVNYNWASNVPGQNGIPGKLQANLPNIISLSGLVGSAINFIPTIPAGYGIVAVTGPDGKSYTDNTTAGMTALQAAQAANPTFVSGMNNFTITLQALMQTVGLNVVVDQSDPTPPANPSTQVITTGLTGSPVSLTDVSSTQDWLNNWITNNASGWGIKDYVDPKGQSYTDSMKSLTEAVSGAGGVVLAGDNSYTVNLTYNGSLSFVSVPSTIDFGSHSIDSSEKDYVGALSQSVVVSDTRATSLLTPWTISVTQSSPIQEVTQSGIDDLGNPIYTPVSGGISFMNYLSYDGTILTDKPEAIYSTTTDTSGTTTVINGGTSSLFKLRVPANLQKSNTSFEGSLTWTLTSAP
jgi:hypothetical protein